MADIFGQYGITIGSFTIYYYGILIVVALLICSAVIIWMLKRDGKDTELYWDGLVWTLIPAIIGARLWFVFFPPESVVAAGHGTAWMLSHPFDLTHGPFAIRTGGLGILGAVLGGTLGIYLFWRRHRSEPLVEWLDLVVVALPLGQAIGRWGNYVNKELYGLPTTLPWGIEIPRNNRVSPYTYADMCGESTCGPEIRFHPLFLYESIWNALTFLILFTLWRRYRHRLHTGDIVLTYFILYPVGRFVLEFLRAETAYVAGININQAIMGVTAIVAAGLLIYRHRRGTATPPAAELEATPTPDTET